MIEKEDIIILFHASNNHYFSAHGLETLAEDKNPPFKKDDLKIDLEKMLWSYNEWKNIKIGTNRSRFSQHFGKYTYGVIGVYNIKDISHLDNMLSAVQDFTAVEYPDVFLD